MNLKKKQKIPLKRILVKEFKYSSNKLRKRLIDELNWKDECKICNQCNIWNGKKLVMHLDHINGDHYDQQEENLRILCPNCHTQTPTYCRGYKNKVMKF